METAGKNTAQKGGHPKMVPAFLTSDPREGIPNE